MTLQTDYPELEESLKATINTCLGTPDFMKEYRRLTKARLGTGSGIEIMIDKATGYDEKEAKDLFDFIRDYIWLPVLAQGGSR